VAIAHDYLTQRGGAERVVLAMLRAFPEATVHTLLYDPDGTFPEFRDARVVTSPLDRIGPLRRNHRLGLPVLAPAASRMTVDADVTIVSTSGWAHGFDVRGRSVVYCHNPARWLYQGDEYLGERPRRLTSLALGALAAPLRRWDQAAMRRHDRYLVNSPMLPQFNRDADGGLTLLIQHESPGRDEEANWLPAPSGSFFMVMRLYWPKEEALSGKWTAPLLTRA